MARRNLGIIDRALRIGGGLALVGLGIERHRGIAGYLFPLIGGMLMVEGFTSHSFVNDLLSFSTGKFRRLVFLTRAK